MTRTITIEDAETGITASVVVAAGTDGRPLVRSVTVQAGTDRGVQGTDLLLLESMGLTLPRGHDRFVLDHVPSNIVTEAVPEGVTAVDGPPVRVESKVLKSGSFSPSRPAAPRKSSQTGTDRPYRRTPSRAILAADYARFKGSIQSLAEEHGVPTYTMRAWVNRARRDGDIPGGKPGARKHEEQTPMEE